MAETQPVHWSIKYIVTVETTIIISLIAGWITLSTQYVTKEDLEKLHFPYPPDKPLIYKHMNDSEQTLEKIAKSVQLLNERITQVNYEHTIRITRLEDAMKRGGNL